MEPRELATAEFSLIYCFYRYKRFSNLVWLIIYLFYSDFSGFTISARQEQKHDTKRVDSVQDIILITELTVHVYSDVCNINSSFSTLKLSLTGPYSAPKWYWHP